MKGIYFVLTVEGAVIYIYYRMCVFILQKKFFFKFMYFQRPLFFFLLAIALEDDGG